jgi:hypothetical protein
MGVQSVTKAAAAAGEAAAGGMGAARSTSAEFFSTIKEELRKEELEKAEAKKEVEPEKEDPVTFIPTANETATKKGTLFDDVASPTTDKDVRDFHSHSDEDTKKAPKKKGLAFE